MDSSGNSSKFFLLTLLAILLLSLPISIYLVQQRQNNNTKAIPTKKENSILSKSLTYNQALAQNKLPQVQELLELKLFYTEYPKKSIVLKNVRKVLGFETKYEAQGESYKLELSNAQNKVFKTTKFSVPKTISLLPPLNKNEKTQSDLLTLRQLNFVLTVPYTKDLVKLEVLNQKGFELSSLVLPKKLSSSTAEPNFRTIPGGAFLQEQTSDPFANVTDDKKYLDITFIGSNYSQADLEKFHSDVDRFAKELILYEPFKSRASQILFHFLDNTSDLDCLSNNGSSSLFCDPVKVWQTINNAGVPTDKAIVIVNNDIFCGGGNISGNMSVVCNGSFSAQAFVHELGHNLGLWDEYVYQPDNPLDNKVYANCYAGLPPSSQWKDIVPLKNYTKGCTYNNWFRPSPKSLMQDVLTGYFNNISQKIINLEFDSFSGSFSDIVKPVSSISSPAKGQVLSGASAIITASASDNLGVAWVELWKDNSLNSISYQPIGSGYQFDWKPTQEQNGLHTLQTKAYDSQGNVGVSEAVEVFINNPSDNTPPTVKFELPPDGAVVGDDVVFIVVRAEDDVDMAKIEFLIDEKIFSTTTTDFKNMLALWDSTKAIEGKHKLEAVAYDWTGNKNVATIYVEVKHNDTTSPEVFMVAPVDNAVVDPDNIWIVAKANDTYGVTRVELYADNVRFATGEKLSDSNFFGAFWDATNLPKESVHKLYAKAYDAAGNEGISKTFIVTIKGEEKPSCQQVTPSSETTSQTEGNFEVFAGKVGGADLVWFAVWTKNNWQDDLFWYQGEPQGFGGGQVQTWVGRIDLSKHTGIDTIYVQAYANTLSNPNPVFGTFCGETSIQRIPAPTIMPTPTLIPTPIPTEISVDNPAPAKFTEVHPSSPMTIATSGAFDIIATGATNTDMMWFGAWTLTNQIDDLVWYQGINSGGGTWIGKVDLSKHTGIDTIFVRACATNKAFPAIDSNTVCKDTFFQRIP